MKLFKKFKRENKTKSQNDAKQRNSFLTLSGTSQRELINEGAKRFSKDFTKTIVQLANE